MNTKLTLTAIAMFAVIMGMSALAPAMAVPKDPKVDVCHYQEFVEEDLLADPPIIGEEEAWKVINIRESAVPAHLAHTDGDTNDFVIPDDGSDDEGNDTVAECEALDAAL